jgi:hypothetical protein
VIYVTITYGVVKHQRLLCLKVTISKEVINKRIPTASIELLSLIATCRHPSRHSHIPLLQHEPDVHTLFVTKCRHAPDSMMTQGTAPQVQQVYSQPVPRYSSLRGRSVTHYRHVIRRACQCVENKVLFYLADQQILNKEYKAFLKKPELLLKSLYYTLYRTVSNVPFNVVPLYWRYTVPNVSSTVGMLPGTHCLQ